MSLGETISRLRSERGMSQGDLADELNVSRQSISKWETDSSVPELDKLIKLSRLFGVSLDELVLDEKCDQVPESTPSAEAPPQPQPNFPPRKIVGIILLCMDFIIIILVTLLGSFLGGIIYASPFFLCGIICLVFHKRVGLWCSWTIYFLVDVYLRLATGINWRLTLYTMSFEPQMNYIRLIVAWVQLLCMISLIIITIFSFRKTQLNLTPAKRNLLVGGWVLLAVMGISFFFLAKERWFAYSVTISDWTQLILFTTLLVITICSMRKKET